MREAYRLIEAVYREDKAGQDSLQTGKGILQVDHGVEAKHHHGHAEEVEQQNCGRHAQRNPETHHTVLCYAMEGQPRNTATNLIFGVLMVVSSLDISRQRVTKLNPNATVYSWGEGGREGREGREERERGEGGEGRGEGREGGREGGRREINPIHSAETNSPLVARLLGPRTSTRDQRPANNYIHRQTHITSMQPSPREHTPLDVDQLTS